MKGGYRNWPRPTFHWKIVNWKMRWGRGGGGNVWIVLLIFCHVMITAHNFLCISLPDGILSLSSEWLSSVHRAWGLHYEAFVVPTNGPCHRVQTGSGAHPASYPMVTRGSSVGVERPGREADHSPPSSAKVNAWNYTSTPHYAFMAWCSVKALITQFKIYIYIYNGSLFNLDQLKFIIITIIWVKNYGTTFLNV
jgi:hypothetical protein